MNHRRSPFTILLLLLLFFSSHQTSAVDFIFNSFNSANSTNSTGNLLLYGSAAVDAEILTLTNSTAFTIGRALFPQKIRTRNSSHVLPFSTSFIFAMAPYEDALPGHGLVFLFVPFTGISGASSSQNLGFLNRTNDNDPNTHVFGVEFDVFANQEFNDIDDNHVGIDLNSLTSRFANTAGYWPDSGRGGSDFKPLKLNSGENYQVWIDYRDNSMNVTMARAGDRRPLRPLLNVSIDLSEVFEDEMFVGFTAATGQLVQSHKILGWSFSNSNFSISEGLIVTGLPSFVLKSNSIVESKGFVIGIAAGSVFVAICIGILIAVWLIKRSRRMKKKKQDEEDGMEDWELEYWPHRISYQEIESATKGFSEENVIGIGGNGKVYKGVLAAAGGDMIAVKRISPENDGTREFLAEIASLGRLKHRNLVGLRGWCKREKGTFLLVYDYMENGSLDQWIFDSGDGRGEKLLTWHDRIRILTDVAAGIRYLHEGWEVKVLHRDIKASNVLLDKEMNGRLGDFGLARMHEHGQVARTTRVVGTAGYLAPEVIHTGRVSDRTDVFGFGILILEVVSGRRPIVGNVTLVDAMWELMREGKVMECVDRRVRGSNSNRPVDEEEVERVVRLGLVCAHPEPSSRPTMRQVAKVLEVGRIGSETEVAESEDMDAYLLQRAGTDVWMDRYSRSDFGSGWGSHPTMDDVRPTTTSSGSGSWSTTIIEGR
ncbi:L-type lectin-domain containing receptor kinase VII.1 [Linum grandiflorum]